MVADSGHFDKVDDKGGDRVSAGTGMRVSLVTGDEPHYQLGLISGLREQDLVVEVIGGTALRAAPVMGGANVEFLGFRPDLAPGSPKWWKLLQVLGYYFKLAVYAAKTKATIIHIQWPYKFVYFDRTLLNVYYKLLGKKVVFTAHNVDSAARDGTQTWSNRATLRFFYRIVDHIIVHTEKMKEELVSGFGVPVAKISVIPHGINCAVPETSLSRAEARKQLHLGLDTPLLLFFGLISPYKGLDQLIKALASLRKEGRDYRLIVAGRIKECEEYWGEVCKSIEDEHLDEYVTTELKYIPDSAVEAYFKAADALVMPYRGIFQSGVLFLAYRFGLPVIATDVGSFREDIIEGRTGFIVKREDPVDLARAIKAYFDSDLYKQLETRRQEIRDYANERYSWKKVAAMTTGVYARLLGKLLPQRVEHFRPSVTHDT